MQYRVLIIESEHGFAASCPDLRGCVSQGDTRAEAVENIKSAIREWLDAEVDERKAFSLSEEIVSV